MPDADTRVTALYVYPVKACAGTALEVAQIGPRGILNALDAAIARQRGERLEAALGGDPTRSASPMATRCC
jgi:hypothetical protein